MKKRVVKPKVQEASCPCCGYCPTCGRSNIVVLPVYIPTYVPTFAPQPFYNPFQPTPTVAPWWGTFGVDPNTCGAVSSSFVLDNDVQSSFTVN